MARFPPGVALRDATPADAEAIHALYHVAYSPAEDPFRAQAGVPLKDTVDDVRAYTREHAVLLAEDADGTLLATAHLRAIANVRRLAVRPGRKGGGLGAAILEATLERARADGFDHAELDTFGEHPWLPAFYARHGFVERGVQVMPDGTRWLVMRQRL